MKMTLRVLSLLAALVLTGCAKQSNAQTEPEKYEVTGPNGKVTVWEDKTTYSRLYEGRLLSVERQAATASKTMLRVVFKEWLFDTFTAEGTQLQFPTVERIVTANCVVTTGDSCVLQEGETRLATIRRVQ